MLRCVGHHDDDDDDDVAQGGHRVQDVRQEQGRLHHQRGICPGWGMSTSERVVILNVFIDSLLCIRRLTPMYERPDHRFWVDAPMFI